MTKNYHLLRKYAKTVKGLEKLLDDYDLRMTALTLSGEYKGVDYLTESAIYKDCYKQSAIINCANTHIEFSFGGYLQANYSQYRPDGEQMKLDTDEIKSKHLCSTGNTFSLSTVDYYNQLFRRAIMVKPLYLTEATYINGKLSILIACGVSKSGYDWGIMEVPIHLIPNCYFTYNKNSFTCYTGYGEIEVHNACIDYLDVSLTATNFVETKLKDLECSYPRYKRIEV